MRNCCSGTVYFNFIGNIAAEASEASDTSDEEDEEEPSETEPGQRLLWAAQRGKMELVKEIVETAANPREVVRHADEDGYTALHRDAMPLR